jgi:KUP system potassium uptake protein
MSSHHSNQQTGIKKHLVLALAALGVVYGDIGTSPLYAIKEIFFGHHELERSPENILGVTSLVLWALTIIVTFKYVVYVLRADNDGEGGVFALYGLLHKKSGKYIAVLTTLLILAAGLLFGDGIITPAISVISAVEGLNVATHAFEPFVVPITVAILTGLFLIQSKGTAKIGKVFGPIVALWFGAIAAIGFSHLIHTPQILEALNPVHAAIFLMHHHLHQLLLVLGSIMLVVTGGEAMYADMGHFGRKPIRMSWFSAVYPALILNYLGQGAYLLSGHPIISGNIFFSMVPAWALYPMIALATLATIIASQALITGAFSLTTQAIALGLVPYLKTIHTHQEHEGQIYVPFVNWALFIGCVLLVFMFKNSSNLASAYGLAVSGVMLVTTLSMIPIARKSWNWSRWKALLIFLPLAGIDLMFLCANSLKIFQGGYVPLLIGLFVLVVMKTWQWGRTHVKETYSNIRSMTVNELVKMKKEQKFFLPRPIVIMAPEVLTKPTDHIPFLKQVFVDRYGALPKHLIFLSIVSHREPHLHTKRFEITKFYESKAKGSIVSVQMNFGFMEEKSVEGMLEGLAKHKDLHIDEDPSKWLIHVAHERVYPQQGNPKLNNMFKRLRFQFFSLLLKNANSADQYFGLGKTSQLTIESIPVCVRP